MALRAQGFGLSHSAGKYGNEDLIGLDCAMGNSVMRYSHHRDTASGPRRVMVKASCLFT